MKKIVALVTVALLFFVSATKAQIERSNLLVGADIANFNLNLNKGGYFNMRIDPKLAFFIRNNIAIGPYLNIGLTTAKGAGTSIDYGIGILGRYYINDSNINLLKHGRFFLEANVGIEGSNPSDASGRDNTNGLGLGAGPGYAYFITSNIALETLLKYNGIVGFGSVPTSSNLNLSFGFQIYLGSVRAREIIRNQ
jgi:hypothetical protein